MDITEEEKVTAQAYRAFEESLSVQELLRQHREGLITAIELAHHIIGVWHHFKRLPQNANVKFYN
jgi:hypothetical protein